jgi:hypothetical protein
MRRARACGPALVLALALGVPCQGQQAPATPRWTWPRASVEIPQRQQTAVAPVGAALSSLVLPGAGQHRLGQARRWVYLGVEVTAWIVHFERGRRGADLRDRYRDLAWAEARIQGTTRVDGDFSYYETLSYWVRSGAFDGDAATSGVQPETDALAYNGFIWERARAIFFPVGQVVGVGDPVYAQALAYYQANAYGTELLWDWSGSPDGQARLGALIGRSDDRFRQATAALGAVLLNHFVSAVDAYVSARARIPAPARVRIVPDAAGHGVWLHVRLPVGP